MAYEIIPGVRQGVNPRTGEYYLYQIGRYPNGKGIEVPYTPDPKAEKAYSIPVPVEEKRVRKERVFKSHEDTREHLVAFRLVGRREHQTMSWKTATHAQQAVNDLRDLQRSPDCGKTWVPAVKLTLEWCVQYITEEKSI